MSVVRMELESIRDLARQLDLTASVLEHYRAELKSGCARLSWAWQGPEAGRFRSELKWLVARLPASGSDPGLPGSLRAARNR